MIEKVKGHDHYVIKRDGRLQKYNPRKLKKAIDWCTNHNETLTQQLFESLNLKIYDKIKIEKLWDEVIETAANLISEMYPIWDDVAKRAYLLKVYKETYNLKSDVDSLEYMDVLKKGMSAGVYNRDIINTFTDEEIHELGEYIKRERDLNFSFIGLVTMMEKYSFNANQHQKLELPQHVYMRVAIQAFWKEPKDIRLDLIKRRYDDLSLFRYTEATPKMLNSLTYNSQMSSCVLNTVEDDTKSITKTDANLALFSKYGGGLALDVSRLRCSGSILGKNTGKSSGPIQFIKKFENTVQAFDQMGKRKGAMVVTFPFWHMDVFDMVMLKDAGGSDDKRARSLQYAIKWYNIFSERIKKGQDITLFDPKDVQDLNDLWGNDFKERYEYYEEKVGLRKKKVPARDLAFTIAKVRSETGNLYITFVDNINKQRIGEKAVFSSNLCQEICIPSKPAIEKSENIKCKFGTEEFETITVHQTGEIGLCNLSSINIMEWIKLSKEEKQELSYNLLRASDNLIDYAFYPVPDGELSNKNRRPIGIGVSNYAQYLAYNEVKFDDKTAEQLTHEIFEDITFYIIEASVKLAKERGFYKHFKESNWAKGLVPMDLYAGPFTNSLLYPLKHNWYDLQENIKQYGVRFSYHFAIAPTATSGQVITATEGIEPIKELFMFKEGTYTLPQLAPNLQKLRMYYQNAFEIDNKVINTLSSIRQKFLDQSQSVSHYYVSTDSAFEIIQDIIDAEEKGLKTLYYLQPKKMGEMEHCESCSS